MCEPYDYFDSWITDTALDAAHVGAIKAGFFCEFVLREAAFGAELCDVPAEGSQRLITFWHGRNIAPKSAVRLWTIGYNLSMPALYLGAIILRRELWDSRLCRSSV